MKNGTSDFRVIDCGDAVAIDNRPAVDRAKAEFEPFPEFRHAVMPLEEFLDQIGFEPTEEQERLLREHVGA